MSNKEADFLNLGLGSGVVTVTVQEITFKDAPVGKNGETAKKIVLNCTNGSSHKLKEVDEAWVKQRHPIFQNKGLWLTIDQKSQTVSPMSALGKVMAFNNCKTIKDLQGKEIQGIYKSNGFLALLTEQYEESQEFTSNK